MNNYNVLYRDNDMGPLDFDVFECQAENTEHAKEHCEDAYPDCEILWIGMNEPVEDTLRSWFYGFYEAL